MYPLLHLMWITNKVLLYSTWNCSILCASLEERGVWGRMDTFICVTESLCCSPETTTTLLIGYTPIQNVFGVIKKKLSKNMKITGLSLHINLLWFATIKNSTSIGPGFDPWVREIPWSMKWQPTPIFSPGKFHGQRSPAGYSSQGRIELNTTGRLTLQG